MSDKTPTTTPQQLGRFAGEPDYSDPSGDDFEALARDRVPVRSMRAADLEAIVAIDRRITGQARPAYFRRKLAEVLEESGVRVSLVAERGEEVVGFAMARVDYGEFGRAQSAAVLDTIGVDPAARGHQVGRALISQLLANLASLRVEVVRTQVRWDALDLLGFLAECGFRPAQHLALTRPLQVGHRPPSGAAR